MPNGGIRGPMGAPRPLARCNQQITVQLLGDPDNLDTDAISNELDFDSTVSARPARLSGDIDLVVATRGSNILDEELDDVMDALAVVNPNFQVEGWRIEAV